MVSSSKRSRVALEAGYIGEDGVGDLLGGVVAVGAEQGGERSWPYISAWAFSASRMPSETKTMASPGWVVTLNLVIG